MTEDGPAPWLASYGLVECPEDGYPARTRRNVADAGALLWFGNPWSPGGRLTFRCCEESAIDSYTVIDRSTPEDVADWLRHQVVCWEEGVALLVAGNRESGSPGIGAKAEAFLRELFRLLKDEGR